MNIFVLFLWICSGENVTVLFSPTTTNILVKYFPFQCKFSVFSWRFLRVLIEMTGKDEKINSKMANCFYTKVLLKLGSHNGNHNCRLGRQNLMASDSSLKVRRQSIPTNCLHSGLSSSPFIR